METTETKESIWFNKHPLIKKIVLKLLYTIYNITRDKKTQSYLK